MSDILARCQKADWQLTTFNNGGHASADYRSVIAPKPGST